MIPFIVFVIATIVILIAENYYSKKMLESIERLSEEIKSLEDSFKDLSLEDSFKDLSLEDSFKDLSD